METRRHLETEQKFGDGGDVCRQLETEETFGDGAEVWIMRRQLKKEETFWRRRLVGRSKSTLMCWCVDGGKLVRAQKHV